MKLKLSDCCRVRLAVRHCHFDLTQQIYHLLRLVLLASSHMLYLSSCLLSTGTFQAGQSIPLRALLIDTLKRIHIQLALSVPERSSVAA